MLVYYIFAGIIIAVQTVVLVEAYRNLRYTLRKYRPKLSHYQPAAAVVSPCKGIDTTFERNIHALFEQDYPNYELFFVVESTDDPAYDELKRIIADRQAAGSKVRAHLCVAGLATQRAQKVHNQLAVLEDIGEDIEVLAFIDSDACPKSHFLSSLVYPLRKDEVGATTGYRWFVPQDHGLATLTLSAVNAFFASVLGPHDWNSTWGGGMAMRRSVFEELDVKRYWDNACTDDYTLSRAVRDADREIVFAPSCYVASYESTTWSEFFTFARRQFLITRVCMPRLWQLAFLGLGHFLAGFWIGVIVTVSLAVQGHPHARYAAILPGVLAFHWIIKALARQIVIRRILPEDRGRLVIPAAIDVVLNPVIHLFTLVCLIGSACSRRTIWRGKRYTMHSLNHTEITELDGPGGVSSTTKVT